MEEKEEMKQSHHQEETEEEKPNNQDETTQENSQLSEDTKEERPRNGEETMEHQVLEAGEIQVVSLKKPKPGSKQNQKAKLTIPQPFSLATERRMSGERRRGSQESKDSKPKLSKSVSLNFKDRAITTFGSEHSSGLSHGTSVTTSRSTRISNVRVEKRIENGPNAKEKVKEVESKKSQTNTKKQEEESETMKLRKSSTFRASPLPSFYHRKDPPPRPELKKIPVTRPKSPQLGQRSKSISESGNNKAEEKNKRVSRIISSSTAKETINKLLLRNTGKSPNIREKEMAKSAILSA